jgi:hypothetical protein
VDGVIDFSETRKLFDWRDHLEVHPAADPFPLMSADELKALADDIRKNGLRQDIVIGDDEEGGLLDGRNRLDAIRQSPADDAPRRLDRPAGDRHYAWFCWDRDHQVPAIVDQILWVRP